MRKLAMELRKRRNDQKGFTLIEMLVVISILGILAAIVTLSMVGITGLAQQRANSTEQKTVQVALDAMAAQQQLTPVQICANTSGSTNDMSNFPIGSAANGSNPQPGTAEALYPNFIRDRNTHQSYSCDSTGQVQVAP
jgi:prepilin-type N-terminal cleavage/methylation domain-containing protein